MYQEVTSVIKHIVLWKINPELDKKAVLAEFSRRTEYLKTIIPEIKEARVALSYAGEYELCIDSVFENDEELQIYINNPEHLKTRAWLNTVTCAKTSFDYVIE